ncbi:DUF4244 domain-containing protein [Cellulomonas sp. URHB0016]
MTAQTVARSTTQRATAYPDATGPQPPAPGPRPTGTTSGPVGPARQVGRGRWRAVRPSLATGVATGTVVQTARHLRRLGDDAGMATAEYAIATLAAVGFAGLLVVILKGNEVKSMLMALVRQALTS